MSLPTKEELGAKLLDYPLLRQLLFERWFRWAFVGFALVFIFMGLFLPKIWRTSRPGFMPVIRVSGLDLVQAWSLKRTALKAQAAGKFDEANYAWQAALANNRADADLVRGALRNALLDPRTTQRAGPAIREAFWLLKLTGTNVSDLQLAAPLLERVRYYDPILSWLEPRLDQLTPELRAVYLKTLFNEGRMDTFKARWDELGRDLAADPELGLYWAAYRVGWGPPDSLAEPRRRLDEATNDPALRRLALRLKMTLAARELNVVEYSRALKSLEELREDTVQHHARYWRLLAQDGRQSEAEELARGYAHAPASATELVELAQVYAELGMHDQALQLYQANRKTFEQAPVFWVAYASMLLDDKNWEAVRNLAIQIRSSDDVRDVLAGFSYFLEGRAELGSGRDGNAAAAFQKAAERDYPFPSIGLRVAAQLAQLSQPQLASVMLARLEKSFDREVGYWTLVFRAAEQVKDTELMLKSAARAYELNPRDPVASNNYAAALLITRRTPELAIRLTLPFLLQNPRLPHAIVNHGAALLMNGRAREAQPLLEGIPTNVFNRTQLTLYNLDLFDLYLQLGRQDLALATSKRIELDRLYPVQRQWFEKQRQQLSSPDNGAAGSARD